MNVGAVCQFWVCGNWKFWWAIRISMVAHRASGNKINNIMVVREFLIVCAI